MAKKPKKSTPVFTLNVEFTKGDVQEIIDTINELELDEDGEPLTYEEVTDNPELLKYLINQLDVKQLAMYDLFEIWNADGWHDVRKYRKQK